ncbi:hypothetical protein PISMIDRAFT_670244 [Pisolithus microcarpus 441]|uniref:Uncharacterized protein n=1 Tax=Pisolithus microcarpus 441 TaxID=765257 RepID=A0A0C9ZPG5_9AGAM|nr:hypothetical protein PISMIDRAFT_670244 [Pisolithus microcarpus 441]
MNVIGYGRGRLAEAGRTRVKIEHDAAQDQLENREGSLMLVLNHHRRNVTPDRDFWHGRWRSSVKVNVDIISRHEVYVLSRSLGGGGDTLPGIRRRMEVCHIS